MRRGGGRTTTAEDGVEETWAWRMSPQPHLFRLHRAPLPLSLSLTAPAAELLAVTTSPAVAAAGFGERWATTTGRAAVPSDLGEESEVGGGDPISMGCRGVGSTT
uniref:DUF834 domain-containing protein n=1 Tax=Oryza barthii TaxID=65489 RepID=A0A0D3HM56_9ORYZ